ncbi:MULTISPECIES: hypothetical protein [unclassified Frankia]|jgi:hypothetical protein|nr:MULTISPECIES: hypothetical protein [unclassified Frankia]
MITACGVMPGGESVVDFDRERGYQVFLVCLAEGVSLNPVVDAGGVAPFRFCEPHSHATRRGVQRE